MRIFLILIFFLYIALNIKVATIEEIENFNNSFCQEICK